MQTNLSVHDMWRSTKISYNSTVTCAAVKYTMALLNVTLKELLSY